MSIPQGTAVNVTDLSLAQAIALLSVLEYCGQGSKHTLLVKQMRNQNSPFAPTQELCGQLLQNLVNGRILRFSPRGAQKARLVVSNICVNAQPSNYVLTEHVTPELIDSLRICLSNGDWPEHWLNTMSDVVFDLAWAEVREFYEFCSIDRGFPLLTGEALNVLLECLHYFSVGQCFHIIFRGAQSAADFVVRNDISLRHAARYMLKVCKNYAERARSSNKILYSFSRNWNCPRSIFSSILYDDVLKIYGDGTSTPISEVRRVF